MKLISVQRLILSLQSQRIMDILIIDFAVLHHALRQNLVNGRISMKRKGWDII